MNENRPNHCGGGNDDPAAKSSGGKKLTRREILSAGLRGGAGLLGAAGLAGLAGPAVAGGDAVWQLDPYKCIQCGNCATYCVLGPSAVRCVHAFDVCAYCKPCFGFFDMVSKLDTGAENQLCPVGAIRRTYVTDIYYQYTIDESLCIGCGKCVKGCATFGNGSLFLQVRHDLCVNCNQCSIAESCPTGAFSRVSRKNPYILKTKDRVT